MTYLLPKRLYAHVFALLLLVAAAGHTRAQEPAHCDERWLEDASVFAAPLCLPAVPQRVVVLDPSFGLAIGLDVGLPIVGAPLDRMSDTALNARAREAGIASLGFVTEPSLETLVALQPDLVVGFLGSDSLASGVYPMVSQLAPTLLYADTDWRAFARLMASFTGRGEEIEAAFARLDARLVDLRARAPEARVSVLRITSWDFQVYLDSPGGYAPFNLMREAGIRRSPYETTEDPSEVMKRPDWEELAGLDGDVLLYIVGGTNDSETDGRFEEVLSNPLWKLLPAVQAGRAYRVGHGHWMQFSGLGSAHRVLDDLERYVIGEE